MRDLRGELSAAVCAALALAVAIGLGRFGFTAAFPLISTLAIHATWQRA